MSLLTQDNWFEVMIHLDIHLWSLALTCKYIYTCYERNKNRLCDEGNYRFSPFQHKLLSDMLNHIDKPYYDKHSLLLQVNNNIGTKVAILTLALQYKGTVVIMCHKKENIKWQQEINKLYSTNIYKINNKQKSILICKDKFCNNQLVQFGRTHNYDPNLMGYKIVIINKGKIVEIEKHSILIIYKLDILLTTVSRNTILFGGKSKSLITCNYIEYPHIKPILLIKDLCCYHDEEPLLKSVEHYLKPLNQRLDDIITQITLYYDGPYLIIGDKINTSHPLRFENDLRCHDITFTKYDFNTINSKIKTIIILWPAHTHIDIDHKINQLDHYQLNIFNIHSTIEEKYLRYVDKSLLNDQFPLRLNTRPKMEFLSCIRKIGLKYDLDQLPHEYITLLRWAKDLDKVYDLIKK